MNKQNKTAIIVQPVKRLAMEVQERRIYEMTLDFCTPTELAETAAQIAYRLAYIDYDTGRLRFHDKRTASFTALGLNWKVVNSRKGSYVSVANDHDTALSSAEDAFFHNPYSFTKEEVEKLLDKMNAAWYRLTNE